MLTRALSELALRQTGQCSLLSFKLLPEECSWRFGYAFASILGANAQSAPPVHAYSTTPPAVEIKKVLVANRGEIACRVITTAKRLGITAAAVFSDVDRLAPHVQLADESYCIGPAPAKDSYLRGQYIVDIASKARVDAIHPGYGFLSENSLFADMCESNGIRFIGPPSSAIRAMGNKSEAKIIMSAAGVPVVPGYHGEDQDESVLLEAASDVGYPLLVKALLGGGGKGMKLANSADEVASAISSAKREALAAFGDDRVLLERYIQRPRHVEVQVFADMHGDAVYLFDRDCSVQRRHQKIIEEAPAPGLSEQFHRQIGEAAVRAAKAVGYCNAGTVEFIVDTDTNDFFFMEMNTRLQVEHPVTEAVTGLDLVELQLLVASGRPLPFTQEQLVCRGHAFEARLYAESPQKQFLPGSGQVRRWRPPSGSANFYPPDAPLRVDSGVQEGGLVGTHYDPMIAKIIVRGDSRTEALQALRSALAQTQVAGLPTNLHFLQRLAGHPAFEACQLDTAFIPRHADALLAPRVPPPHLLALAAVARHLTEVQAAARSSHQAVAGGPWGVSDSLRLWQRAQRRMSLALTDGQQPADVALTCISDKDFQVEVAGAADAAPLAVVRARLSGDRLEAEVGGRLLRCDVVSYQTGTEGVLALWLDGGAYEFRWPSPQRLSKDAAAVALGGQVTAPMPGKVVKVFVGEGQTVSTGTPLLAMEAMKMEHTLLAPCGGVVTGLGVVPGSQVDDGTLLLSIVE